MMTHRSNDTEIKAHDIFVAEHYFLDGKKYKHYFYCIYAQSQDRNNSLFKDIIGFFITTKKPYGYNEKIKIGGRESYVCCDRLYNFPVETEGLTKIYTVINKDEKRRITKRYKKFIKESLKQIKGGKFL